MNVVIRPQPLSGTVTAPSSKSDIQRIAVCAMMADNKTVIRHNSGADDVRTVFSCLSALGAEVAHGDGYTSVIPHDPPSEASLFCGESGAVSRFLIPAAAAICGLVRADGLPGLRRRPLLPLVGSMRQNGCEIDSDSLPMEIKGRLLPGDYRIRGDISSQFISGLLMALPKLSGPSRIITEGKTASSGYIEMTLSVLREFGVRIEKQDNIFLISPSGYLSPGEISAEGDWSCAAYILACGSGVSASGLRDDSLQRDKMIKPLIGEISSLGGGDLVIDVSDIPDLVPALAAVASVCHGSVRIVNAGRLRVKESDRLETTHSVLAAMGADISVSEDGLIIRGVKKLHSAVIPSYGDHRIVMAAAAAAARSAETGGFEGELKITNAEAVNKSYPGFFDHYRFLGGDVSYEL